MKLKFKVKKRTHEECEHDTGVIHSSKTPCQEAGMIIKIFAMNENDPDHEAIWHNEKMNPLLIKLEV